MTQASLKITAILTALPGKAADLHALLVAMAHRRWPALSVS